MNRCYIHCCRLLCRVGRLLADRQNWVPDSQGLTVPLTEETFNEEDKYGEVDNTFPPTLVDLLAAAVC